MVLIDAHAHLDHYQAELDAALAEIDAEPILTIGVSMDLPSYRRTQAIAAGHRWIVPTFGIHPWIAAPWAARLDELTGAAAESPMLGEIGLDYHWVEDTATYPAQREVLAFFLQAAAEQGKIVNLHTKGAEQDVLDLLRRYDVRRAIIHWYSGPLDVLDELIANGCYFTVGVEVLTSKRIRRIARRIPDDRLLTETDNPGGWTWIYPGEVGMPSRVGDVVNKLAEMRRSTPDAVEQRVQANFARLIDGDPHMARVAALLTST